MGDNKQSIVSFFWLIIAVFSFAALGILVAKTQVGYEDTLEEHGTYSSVVESAEEKENHATVTYGVAGAAVGLVVGLFNISHRQRDK